MLVARTVVLLWQFQICFFHFQCSVFSLLSPEAEYREFGWWSESSVSFLGFLKNVSHVDSIQRSMNAWKPGELLPWSDPFRSCPLTLGSCRIPGGIQQWAQLSRARCCIQRLVPQCSLLSWQLQMAAAHMRHGCFLPSHFTVALLWQPAWTSRASRFISKCVFC